MKHRRHFTDLLNLLRTHRPREAAFSRAQTQTAETRNSRLSVFTGGSREFVTVWQGSPHRTRTFTRAVNNGASRSDGGSWIWTAWAPWTALCTRPYGLHRGRACVDRPEPHGKLPRNNSCHKQVSKPSKCPDPARETREVHLSSELRGITCLDQPFASMGHPLSQLLVLNPPKSRGICPEGDVYPTS